MTKLEWPILDEPDDLLNKELERLHCLYHMERDLWGTGCQLIAGIDEAGRGPLAGPVVAAAVILPGGIWLPGLNDSKKVPPGRRQKLADLIKDQAVAWSLAVVDVDYIDQYNIRQASLEAMRRAVLSLAVLPEFLLVDGMSIPELMIDQAAIIHGDSRSASIAAASILAKVRRDELMDSYDKLYPAYGFSQHKGYATPQHLKALAHFGPCPIHRWSFAPVRKAAGEVK